MGTINYSIGEYITIGIKPFDFDDVKKYLISEEYDITDNMVYEELENRYIELEERCSKIIDKNHYDFYYMDIHPGYYEGFTVNLETYFTDSLYSEKDRTDALKETDILKQCLYDLIDEGLCVCYPGWCTGYLDNKESKEAINSAIEKIKSDIDKEEITKEYE